MYGDKDKIRDFPLPGCNVLAGSSRSLRTTSILPSKQASCMSMHRLRQPSPGSLVSQPGEARFGNTDFRRFTLLLPAYVPSKIPPRGSAFLYADQAYNPLRRTLDLLGRIMNCRFCQREFSKGEHVRVSDLRTYFLCQLLTRCTETRADP